MRRLTVTNRRLQLLTNINGHPATIDVFVIVPSEIHEYKLIDSILSLLFIHYYMGGDIDPHLCDYRMTIEVIKVAGTYSVHHAIQAQSQKALATEKILNADQKDIGKLSEITLEVEEVF